MSRPNCDDVAPLLDLFAAEVCDPAQQAVVRAHVSMCDDCQRSLAESRQMLGLLEVHLCAPAALSRLQKRLQSETRQKLPSPSLVIPLHRFAAVAALLLVTFGLGILLTPVAPPLAPLQLAFYDARKMEDVAPPAVPNIARSKEMKIGLGDLPPQVDLDLVLSNPGPEPIEVEIGGRDFRCALSLSGPGFSRHLIEQPKYVPFVGSKQVVPARGTLTLRLERLASQEGGRVEYLYPIPGEHILRVRLEAQARRSGKREVIRLSATRGLRMP